MILWLCERFVKNTNLKFIVFHLYLWKIMSEIIFREIKKHEIEKLEDLLYEAIYQPDEQHLIPRSVLKVPEVYAYIKNFGH